jgi:hypothetical protein
MFFWHRSRRWLPLLFGLVLLSSNAGINPLMRGLSPLVESAIFQEVERTRQTDPDGKWIVYEDALLGSVVQATGAQVLNGTKFVPDLPFLGQLDSTGTAAEVYNRYARVACGLQVFPEEAGFSLVHHDLYVINLPPGLPLLRERGYRFFLFPGEWRDAPFYDFSLAASGAGIAIYRR